MTPVLTENIAIETNDLTAVVTYLQVFALGPENARTRKEIEERFALSSGDLDRRLRIIIGLANKAGIPLASSDAGYFYATSREQFEPMLSRLRHQRNALHERILTIEKLRESL